MLTRAWLLSIVATAAMAEWSPAQQRAAAFYQWAPPEIGSAEDTLVPVRGDYRYEGLAFGGVVFGALGAWLGSRDYAICPTVPGARCSGNSDRVLGGVALGLLGATVGGGVGYLVGKFSPKRPRPDTLLSRTAELAEIPDSIRIRVGYQHWRGAGIGLAVGAAVGSLTGVLGSALGGACDDCTESASVGEAIVMVGLMGAGAGGVVGFLAGLSSPKYRTVPRDASTLVGEPLH